MPDTTDTSNLSLAHIAALRGEAHATIRGLATTIISLSSAVGDVDAALRLAIAERSIDESQGLVTAARRLAALLSAEGQQ